MSSSTSAVAATGSGHVDELIDILWSVRAKVRKRGEGALESLVITGRLLPKAGFKTNDLYRLLTYLGEALGRQVDLRHLKRGAYKGLKDELDRINNATAAWVVGFIRQMQGRPVRLDEAIEILQILNAAFLEAHHVVEKRFLKAKGHIGDALRAVYASEDHMLAVALFAENHRNAVYLALDNKSLGKQVVRDLRKKRGPRPKDLSRRLQDRFNDKYLAKNPTMAEFLRDLDDEYLKMATDDPVTKVGSIITVEMYEGLLKGLIDIAVKTGTPWP